MQYLQYPAVCIMTISRRGTKIRHDQLRAQLESLDIDEGVRIESTLARGKDGREGGNKIFINRDPSGAFVVQYGSSDDFKYLDSARQVMRLVNKICGSRTSIWIY